MIRELYIYPIKGLTGEARETLQLVANEGIAGDRAVAIARAPDVFDPQLPQAAPKTKFLMLALDEMLAKLRTRFDEDTRELVILEDGQQVLSASVASGEGRAAIERFFRAYISKQGVDPAVVSAPGHKFTDISVVSPEKMRAISLINLASVRALSEAVGRPLDLRRFRANIYFDSGTPWEELEWIDRTVQIGEASGKCVMLTKRCPATEVNPDTGERDIRLPKELLKHFGHVNMGIYVEVQNSGDISMSDQLTVM